MKRYLEVAFNLPIKKGFTYLLPENLDAGVGRRVTAPFGSRTLTGFVVAESDAPPHGIEDIREIQRVVDSEPIFSEDSLDLARWMSRMYMCSLGEALSAVLPGGRRETEGEELPPDEDEREYPLAEQQLDAIRRISSRDSGSYYLFGVTGSGKTDVFLRIAQDVVSKGRGVIYLVPEISLTHQVARACRGLFKERLAILHSALTPSQRLREWQRVRNGEVDVAIGARSAVFAPFKSLGLIVIDEEHEGSYKSGSTPRYHARQVAMHRAGKEGAILLMGSATPSVEAYQRMKEGKLERFLLPRRLSGGSLPEVEIVDMRGEASSISKRLMDEMGKAHAERRQTILFLNRRGFSYFFHCRTCGYQMTCSYCSVPLTFHKDRGRMICHYCGFAVPPVEVCPQCGSLDIGYSGLGTEGVEEQLQGLYPGLSIRRIDTDSVRKRRVLRKLLSDFKEGKTDVLIGTQMVAKGLNFPGVKLVGILNADMGFQLPDFRAAERTFSLIVQVSGRAGRNLPDGKVLIQTLQPDNPSIVLAGGGRLEEFYERELEIRGQLGFPPFGRLIRIVLRGKNKEKSLSTAQGLAKALRARLGELAEVLGPVECPISRISGSWRFHAIVRAKSLGPAHERVRETLDGFRPHSGIYIEVDVDPQALL